MLLSKGETIKNFFIKAEFINLKSVENGATVITDENDWNVLTSEIHFEEYVNLVK